MQAVVAERPQPEVSTCRHHWLVDPVTGPTSQARCKLCNVRRVFFNHAEDTLPQA